MKKIDEIKEYLQENIKEKRLKHVLRVTETAEKLAEAHGVSVEKAILAALLHDCAKGNEEKLLKDYAPILEDWTDLDKDLLEEQLVHAPLAVIVAKDVFHIEDEEILSAVLYHTTGRENMTPLEKVVYLADKLEPAREYGGIDKIRKVSEEDLEKAMLLSFDNTIEYLIGKKEPIAMITVKSRNNLLRR